MYGFDLSPRDGSFKLAEDIINFEIIYKTAKGASMCFIFPHFIRFTIVSFFLLFKLLCPCMCLLNFLSFSLFLPGFSSLVYSVLGGTYEVIG